MPRDRDPFWDHVEEVDDRWKCKYCKQRFSLKVSVSRIKSHLSGVSGQGVEVCSNAPAEVQLKAYEAILSKRQRLMLPVLTYDQGQASVSQEMEANTPMHEQLEILNRMTTDMYDVPEIPSIPAENDALSTSGENTAGQMQLVMTMPRSSNNEARISFPAEAEDTGQAEDWELYFNDEPLLQSLTLEDQVPHAQVMQSSSNEELRIADPTKNIEVTGCPKLHKIPIAKKLHCLRLSGTGAIRWENGVPPMFAYLKKLNICGYPTTKLVSLSLLPNLQNLEKITVRDCSAMKEIIASEEREENNNMGEEESNRRNCLSIPSSSEFKLPKLKKLTLWNLPQLESIYWGLLICDSLENVRIGQCRKLKRIPIFLPLPSFKKLKVYPRDLREQVEWGHPIAKNYYSYQNQTDQ
ncbi:hypothetical protein Tsubulata_008782 [Turnera subulata]|uniref:BED-type domain-containing protein n=1 Tax=Turnera subulata TaxID=218843 RepID=A0A9Q0GAR9_9ROSI|nr:hypothetical protein Tsubulata_008782 [Turnera subulata]